MKPIPQEYIDDMPKTVVPTRGSCEAAANATLLVLFLTGLQAPIGQTWPPILSNGRELWPLPPPWSSDEEDQAKLLHDLNGSPGDPGILANCKRNAQEFNEALAASNPELAGTIANQACADSAHVWSSLNALALSAEDEDIYRPLVLEKETKRAYYIAAGIESPI